MDEDRGDGGDSLRPADVPAGTSADVPSQRRADALVRLAESWLAHGDRALAGGERQRLVVHVDVARLAAAGIRAARRRTSSTVTPSSIGPTVAPRGCGTWCCCAGGITDGFMKAGCGYGCSTTARSS
jgi:hypothetical protein